MNNEHYLMDPNTGSVDTYENWEQIFKSSTCEEWGGQTFESAGLITVIKNKPNTPNYDSSYGEWRHY